MTAHAHCPENGWSCPGCSTCRWPNSLAVFGVNGTWTPGFHHPSEFHPSFQGGFFVADDGSIDIVSIATEDEGRGHVGRFLDRLPTDRTIRVKSVGNLRLAGMLKRRDFVCYDAEGMHWHREPQTP